MLPGLAGNRYAAEHSSNFFDARVAFEWSDLCASRASIAHLRDSQVLITEGGHLRQMRHAEHLSRRAKRGKFATDDFGNGATHA
jgi:hypothetical protein